MRRDKTPCTDQERRTSGAAVCSTLLIYIAAAASGLPAAVRTPIYVGILEPPLEQARGQSQKFHVRVAFRFQDGRWSAMPHDAADEDALAKLAAMFPPQVSWTIALHAKNSAR